MHDRGGFSRAQLDELVITIELTLVSLAQSLALATLAAASLDSLIHLEWQYWPYIASGFILILFFWTQAISHALTFINWPINMAHNVIYFVAMMVEVVLFTQVTDPARYFVINAVFFAVGAVFYAVDLAMIRKREADFTRAGQAHLYAELVHDQQLALRLLIPFGALFSLISALAITAFPAVFIDQQLHVWLGLIQAATGLVVLVRSIRDFQTHSTLLGEQS